MNYILHELDKLGYNVNRLNIIDFDISTDYVTFEYPDEPDSLEGGRTMWMVDIRNKKCRHKDHSIGSFWTEWEAI